MVEVCLVNILNPECALADAWSMILSNISRPESLVNNVWTICEEKIDDLVSAFVRTDYNKKNCHLNYLGSIFSNLTQVSHCRDLFCRTREMLSRLLPFIQYENSLVRKGSIVGVLKNICFDSTCHGLLLEEVDVLPLILLPLAGPEDFTDEENDKFPLDLQVKYQKCTSNTNIDSFF